MKRDAQPDELSPLKTPAGASNLPTNEKIAAFWQNARLLARGTTETQGITWTQTQPEPR